ncbi:TPA: hypothetical protein ACPYU1_003800 [Raoultella planticola]
MGPVAQQSQYARTHFIHFLRIIKIMINIENLFLYSLNCIECAY